MKRCMVATDNGIQRIGKIGGAMMSLGKGVGGLGTGVAIAYKAYNHIDNNE